MTAFWTAVVILIALVAVCYYDMGFTNKNIDDDVDSF